MSDAIREAIQNVRSAIAHNTGYEPSISLLQRSLDELESALQHSESSRAMLDAVTHGTGITKGGKHVPLEDFYVQHSGEPVYIRIIDDQNAICSAETESGEMVAVPEKIDGAYILLGPLYTAPQPVVDELCKALSDIAEWTDRYTAPNHPISVIAKKALLSAGKGGDA